MKNIIKKLSVMIVALMLMFGAVISTNVKSIYADDNIITVKFTYVRSDQKYTDYYMKAFMPSGNVDTNGEFMIIGDKAVFECKLQKNVDLDEIISFRVMEKSINEAVIKGEIDITNINSGSIEVVINGDSGTTIVTGTSGSSEFTGEQPETPSAPTETPDEPESKPQQSSPEEPNIAYTEKLDVGDDPNKDYSMKPAMVVVFDVLFLGALGGLVYLVLSKKQNAFM